MQIRIYIENNVKQLGIYLAYSVVENVDNSRVPDELYSKLIPEVIAEIRRRLSLDTLKNELNIRVFRDLYWRLGIDPTKQRPAHEALIRRVLRGEDLPRINPVVDIGNYASIKYMLPVGLYDLDKIQEQELVLRFAREGETVRLLGSGEKRLTQNQIVLATKTGKVLHVFPHRDSEDTSISNSTKNVLIVVAGLNPIPRDAALSCVQEIASLLSRLLGGRQVQEATLV